MKSYLATIQGGPVIVRQTVKGLMFQVQGRTEQEYNCREMLESKDTPDDVKVAIRKAIEALEVWGNST